MYLILGCSFGTVLLIISLEDIFIYNGTWVECWPLLHDKAIFFTGVFKIFSANIWHKYLMEIFGTYIHYIACTFLQNTYLLWMPLKYSTIIFSVWQAAIGHSVRWCIHLVPWGDLISFTTTSLSLSTSESTVLFIKGTLLESSSLGSAHTTGTVRLASLKHCHHSILWECIDGYILTESLCPLPTQTLKSSAVLSNQLFEFSHNTQSWQCWHFCID